MKRLAIVIPWFGKEIKGGAEQHAWEVATRLGGRGHHIEVLTTCCRSFLEDWGKNHLIAGSTFQQGITVRRFPVDLRDRAEFDRVNGRMLCLSANDLKPGKNPVSYKDSEIFVRENINSSALLDYLLKNKANYSAFLFIPYLYGPILNGLPIVADRAYLQPCLHDEVYAYLPQVSRLFQMASRLLFISEGENQLARHLYGPGVDGKSALVGAGVEFNKNQTQNRVLIKNLRISETRFILYLGRRDVTKNTAFLVKAYVRFKERYPTSNLKLVLAGPGHGTFSAGVEGVFDMGLLEEDEKSILLERCLALFQPSRHESYSRVVMEAWLQGRPVAVHSKCLATSLAVKSSQGGWLADNEEEWSELFAILDSISDAVLASYGEKGRIYASENAGWDRVIERYEEVLGLVDRKIRPKRSNLKLKEIHQLLPNLAYGDAISNHALFIKKFLISNGYESKIFAQFIDPIVSAECEEFNQGKLSEGQGLVYHHSIGSELTSYAVKHSGRKVLIYHNITPAHFFLPYDRNLANILENGRKELMILAKKFELTLGDSQYNADELRGYGFDDARVLPLVVDPSKWNMEPDQSILDSLNDGRRNILFVGRLSPNKRQEDLIEMYYHLNQIDRGTRLCIVGDGHPESPYVRQLQERIAKFNLKDDVVITGRVSESQLLAFYKRAHVFVSMSEHEGFGVPLIEAMWFDIPVVAYKSSAVSETLGEAAFLFTDKTKLKEVAALVYFILSDSELRSRIISSQRKVRRNYLFENLKGIYEKNIIGLLESNMAGLC